MRAEEITWRYIFYYLAALLFFYELFMIIPSTWIELLTAQISSILLNFLGFNSDYGLNQIWVWMTLSGGTRDVKVYIIRECTAFHVWGVLLGLVIPLNGPEFGRKLKAVIFGGSLVFLMNITRIMITVYLTGYDVPPFSWFFINPTVETYHYPVSFAYGVIGIAIVISLINTFFLPELGDFLVDLPTAIQNMIQKVLDERKLGN
jgi:exosortase/archaeosortase family protein